MIEAIFLSFILATDMGPVDAALRATEAPKTVRVAFEVEIMSGQGARTYAFDPRLEAGDQWRLLASEGDDPDLDDVGLLWGMEPAPDGRLFPDDLRASMGAQVEVDDLGGAWRLGFRHSPSANDTGLDVWAADLLEASAWIDPVTDRFLRIDYTLAHQSRGPEGGLVTRFDQSWFIETEPHYGLSLITAFSIDFEARAGFRRLARHYSARVTKADVFFASREAAATFMAGKAQN